MSSIQNVAQLLGQVLNLGSRAQAMNADTALLGSIPELDSMAVVNLITAMEDHFGISVADDEISADTFATLGSLSQFVDQKLTA